MNLVMDPIDLDGVQLGGGAPFFLIAGPCVIESQEHCLAMAGQIKEIASQQGIPLIFKASYDKANRTSIHSYRGPGLQDGLQILGRVSGEMEIPVLSDVHSSAEVTSAAAVLDVLQIPAFLSRQTDLIVAAAKTGKILNIKKGQFLAPLNVKQVLEKAHSTGNGKVLITERGTCFGYNTLVVDFKAIPIMRNFGSPVVFDAGHSVQQPGAQGSTSGGQAEFISHLARAAVAVGVDGIFLEVHERPGGALSDSASSLCLEDLSDLLGRLQEIDQLLKGY